MPPTPPDTGDEGYSRLSLLLPLHSPLTLPLPSPLCSEEYFPTVSINALMRVLRDPSLSSQQSVIDALMAILRWDIGSHT